MATGTAATGAATEATGAAAEAGAWPVSWAISSGVSAPPEASFAKISGLTVKRAGCDTTCDTTCGAATEPPTTPLTGMASEVAYITGAGSTTAAVGAYATAGAAA